MTDLDAYAAENRRQSWSEDDSFTPGRYRQFARHLPPETRTVLDVGCGTGRGGAALAAARPGVALWGLDVVPERLDRLPAAYAKGIHGLATAIPLGDGDVDAVVAGEFLEHLQARDVDPVLCEFQRVLRVGGVLLLTTPNPRYLRLRLRGGSVYGPGHLTQHYPLLLRRRLMMHGFSRVRVRGSGRVSARLGERIPLLAVYGAYLITAVKR